MKRLFIGIILGISYIIPGLCSASMAISLGVYNELLELTGNFYKIKTIKKYFFMIIGMIFGLIIAILILNTLFKKIPYYLMMFFLGCILMGYHNYNMIKVKGTSGLKKILLITLGCIIVISSSLTGSTIIALDYYNLNIFTTFIVILLACISSLAFILPGVSGALLLLVLGLYEPLLGSIEGLLSNLIKYQTLRIEFLSLIVVFFVGLIIGIIVFSKIIDKILNKYPKISSDIINGLMIGAILIMIYDTSSMVNEFYEFMIGLIICFISYVLFGLFLKKAHYQKEE